MAEAIAPPPPGFELVGQGVAQSFGLPPPPPGFEVADRRKQPRVASGVGEAFSAGYQGSVAGLIDRGKLPDIVLDPQHSKWYEKLAASAAQLFNEGPEMIGGAMAGGAAGTAVGALAGPGGAIIGGVAGGGAGAFAIPTAIRESLIQAYEKGAVVSSGDFINRAGVVLKATGIDALVGAGTTLAGMGVARGVGKMLAPAIGESIGVTAATRVIGTAGVAAEIGAMTTLPAALHLQLPEPEDFLNAGILVAGLKGSTAAASRIAKVYAKTGVRPEQVVADAKVDPVLAAEIKGEPPKLPELATRVETATKVDDKNVALIDYLEAFVAEKRSSAPDANLENQYFKGTAIDTDRGVARYVEKFKSELPESVSRELNSQNVRDLETGESLNAFTDSVRGGHIGQLRRVRDELRDPFGEFGSEVPSKYEPLRRELMVRDALQDEGHAMRIADVLSNPEGRVTAEKEPNHINYKYVESPDDVKAVHARIAEVFEAQLNEARVHRPVSYTHLTLLTNREV